MVPLIFIKEVCCPIWGDGKGYYVDTKAVRLPFQVREEEAGWRFFRNKELSWN